MSTYAEIGEYLKARYKDRMQQMHEILGGVCAVCGSSERLDIDHINPDTKSFTLGQGWGKPWDEIIEELAKCQLLCRKHHVQKTKGESDIQVAHNKGKVTHGKHYARYTLKCSCVLCAEFHESRMANRRQRQRAPVSPDSYQV